MTWLCKGLILVDQMALLIVKVKLIVGTKLSPPLIHTCGLIVLVVQLIHDIAIWVSILVPVCDSCVLLHKIPLIHGVYAMQYPHP